MIEALILVQLWSLVVAGGAWALQRDDGGRVGTSFPASSIWLIFIVLSILPGVLCLIPLDATISLPEIEAFDLLPIQVSDSSAEGPGFLNYLTVYIGLSLLLMTRTLWRWSRLQSLSLVPTAERGVFTTASEMPPLTLSWPRRAVVIPLGFEAQSALIRHERAHLHHNDAELTLLLLLLQDLMLRNFGLGYLVRQWRLSIELRADQAATKKLTPSERKDYAALLLEGLRSSGGGERDLPCPTAHLTSSRHRDVKMRLTEIVESKPKPRKHRWGIALFLTTLGAGMIGLSSTAASARVEAPESAADNIVYVKKVAAQLPASCPGLKIGAANIATQELTIDGKPAQYQSAKLGLVVIFHDVRRDGSTYNLRVKSSTHPCFEAEAKAALAQWLTEPQDQEIRDVPAKLQFFMTAETIEELKPKLSDFLQ